MARVQRILYHAWQSIKPHAFWFWFSFVMWGIVIFLMDVIVPTFLQRIVDAIVQGEPRASVLAIVFVYIGISTLGQLLFRVFDYAFVRSRVNIQRDMTDYAFAHIMKHGYGFFVDQFAGSVVAKTRRFVRGFEHVYGTLVFQFVSAFVFIIGVFVIVFIESPLLAWSLLAWCVAFIALSIALYRRKVKLDLKEAEEDSKVTGALADAISNALTVLTFARYSHEQRRFRHATGAQREANARSQFYFNVVVAIQGFVMLLLEAGSIWLTVTLYYDGVISLGTVVLVQTYVLMLFEHVWRLGQAFGEVVQGFTDASEFVDLVDAPLEVEQAGKPVSKVDGPGRIEFRDIGFGYGGDNVFDGFSLSISPSERVGIVGTSGAGKSTLTKLLLRFLDVQRGSIVIDGVDVKDLSFDALRSSIAYVPQEPILFHRSLEENIRYGNPKALKRDVIDAARKARAHRFIVKLPEGYKTLVGERGVKLSGGERQRVAIARAMLKDAPILVLDEATSSLDAESEQLIQAAFEEASKGRTTIVIAHRLATVKRLDRIIVLEEGRIVEEGTHRQLLNKKGRYYDLYTHQRL